MLDLFTPDAPLTITEATELAQLEATIERGLRTFVEVGGALLAIRDGRLYRPHQTFEDYCRERWGMERNYANKLIAAAGVIENLGTMVPILPATERQARPLAPLPPEQQREAWRVAVETAPGGKVTAAHVEATVRAMTEREILDASREIRTQRANERRTERTEKLAGVTTVTMRKYFRGEGFYSSTLEALARALEVDPLDLLVRDERPVT